MALPVPTQASSEVLSKAIRDATNTKSTYKFLYFPLNGRGETIRNLLAYGNVDYEDVIADWPAMKKDTRFGCVPVLFETTASGTVLEFSESQAIERYLARKFGLLGSNEWEEHLVNEYVNSVDTTAGNALTKILFAPVETRNKSAEEFYKSQLAPWIQIHEGHLKANGGNGHYVGDKFSWADIKLSTAINVLLTMVPKGLEKEIEALINPEATPNIWKVREAALAHPSLGEWLKSDKLVQYSVANKGFFKF
ncbi:hypothetical protein BGW38_005234 [Lunasporangiospora selenospora]|uniref:glutathione transferase n=1 Tax=Lunasporangiospora selenospora TaxID=979761 RepID=A0A9P6KB08_9FUNG|nr:hypothetical protein BGW38_005234 [Lunasporangiospora selenospora]